MARAIAPAAILSLALSLPAWAEQSVKNPLVDSETWHDLQYDVVGDVQDRGVRIRCFHWTHPIGRMMLQRCPSF